MAPGTLGSGLDAPWQVAEVQSDVQLPGAPAEEFLWVLCTRSSVRLDGLWQEMVTWERERERELCLQPQHRAQQQPNSQPGPVLEAGDDHRCDSSCIYLSLLIPETRITIPAVARAGF